MYLKNLITKITYNFILFKGRSLTVVGVKTPRDPITINWRNEATKQKKIVLFVDNVI